MIKYFQNRFALSEKGAKDLRRGIAFNAAQPCADVAALLSVPLSYGIFGSRFTHRSAYLVVLRVVGDSTNVRDVLH